MSGAGQRLTWLALAGLSVALVSVLAFLYSRTQGYDEADYFENVAHLRQLKQLDARRELDVLKSKIGINTHYDPLVDPLLDLEQLQAELPGAADADSPRARGRSALKQAIDEKTRLIEHFKSHNAVLRNSLAFLPGAADELRQAAGRVPGGAGLRVAAASPQLLLAVLVYNQDDSAEQAAAITAGLTRLAAERPALPVAVGEHLERFAAHVATVLREQQVVGGLLKRIAAVPVASRIDDLNQLLAEEQLRSTAVVEQYRQYLLAFSALLAALLLYMAFCLIRSHAVIRRVNRQLQRANDSLEQRVQQRTRELHAAQQQLLATARQAGMAEIATNVLHNVGNVLNSVNVSAGVLGKRLRASKAGGLARAVQLLDEHAADLAGFLTRDARGQRLPDYLGKLAEALAAEQRELLDELGQLSKSVEHIKDIVATQQSYAGTSRLLEPLQICDLLEDALRMNAGALVRHEVTVLREFAAVPVLPLDRHRLLQILINLISNAKQAMDGIADRPHCLTLRVALADDGRLSIEVADNGEGIAAENLTRIFAHGFTTRRDGHGFGLHSCALAAREMGGSLSAASAGPGCGACFTLLLPVAAGPAA